ncbi:MAG: sodium:proton antiporter [Ruminococcaceae bacterium]|nr:sodium:proton antiporter [Oscillospiraceae bacterium]
MTATSSVLLSLSIALFAGLMLSRVAKKISLPAVTAYLVAGVLIGPFLLGAIGIDGIGITATQLPTFSIIADVALGFIAFSMGNEFRISQLKKIGKQATAVGIFQAVFTTITVDLFLIVLHFIIPDKLSLSAAIVLGAVATATAPAATLMVVRQYKAKGALTDILMPVVAIDDAVGLVVFAVSFGIAKSISLGNLDILSIILEPLLEVVLSLALGFIMGILFNYAEKFFHSRSKRMAMSVTFVMMTVAISSISFSIGPVHIAFSSLLSCMMLGTVFCNICDLSEELMSRADRWTAPILILFFVISGAELELSVFADIAVVVIGIIYIIARSLGKYFGAGISARLTECPPSVIKYLGITLLPQAGVALGMAMKATELGADGAIVRNITLFAVLIYEIVGPYLTKVSLTKAGDIKEEEKTSAREEARLAKLSAVENGEHHHRHHFFHFH